MLMKKVEVLNGFTGRQWNCCFLEFFYANVYDNLMGVPHVVVVTNFFSGSIFLTKSTN